jgi:tetratricopeptide (TPR) repeat protein
LHKVQQPFSRISPPKILLQTCLAGVIIALLVGGVLAVLIKGTGRSFFPSRDIPEEGLFFRKLRDYDLTLGSFPGARPSDTERLTGMLDELEQNALGVESHLSVLKRRRALAAGYAGEDGSTAGGAGRPWSGSGAALAAYQSSAVRAAALFPHSESLAAVAAEALTCSAVREAAGASPLFSGGAAEQVRQYAAVMGGDDRFAPAALSVYVLTGDMANPSRAQAIPGSEALLAAGVEHRQFRNRETLVLDAAILATLKNNAPIAIDGLRPLLERPVKGGNAEKALRFGAELLYDFGDPGRAAELFARFSDEWSIARQADALVLAGRKDAARSLWTVLTAPVSSGPSPARDILIRSLYNLAATAEGTSEETAALERLLALDGEHLYGVIRYTRRIPAPRATAILEDSTLPGREALAGLELLRRRRETWSIDRMVPETWLLINRHPEAEAIFQWAAYYFTFQRRYNEIPPLLRAAERKDLTGSWFDLQRALELIRQGRLDEAEGILKAVPVKDASWEVNANLGRLLEAKRSYLAALENYETAASLVREKTDAAKIQFRIARCLRALGRERESFKVLEYAQTLDGENLNIRLEQERVEQSLF